MNTEMLFDVDQSIKSHRDTIDFGLALDRLRSNREFKQVVLDGYLSKEAIRLVHEKASPTNQNPENQRLLLAQIDAIGCLYQYFNRVDAAGTIAKNSLQFDEQTRELLLSEER